MQVVIPIVCKLSFATTYANEYAGNYAKVLLINMPIVHTAGMQALYIDINVDCCTDR